MSAEKAVVVQLVKAQEILDEAVRAAMRATFPKGTLILLKRGRQRVYCRVTGHSTSYDSPWRIYLASISSSAGHTLNAADTDTYRCIADTEDANLLPDDKY